MEDNLSCEIENLLILDKNMFRKENSMINL